LVSNATDPKLERPLDHSRRIDLKPYNVHPIEEIWVGY